MTTLWPCEYLALCALSFLINDVFLVSSRRGQTRWHLGTVEPIMAIRWHEDFTVSEQEWNLSVDLSTTWARLQRMPDRATRPPAVTGLLPTPGLFLGRLTDAVTFSRTFSLSSGRSAADNFIHLSYNLTKHQHFYSLTVTVCYWWHVSRMQISSNLRVHNRGTSL